MTIPRGLGQFTREPASVGAALARHSGDLTGAYELMQEARYRFSDENPSNL